MARAPRVRPALVEDAVAIGRCHVRAWQAGYRGQMPDDLLEGLDEALRGESWRGALEAGQQAGHEPGTAELAGMHSRVLVVEDDEGEVRGVASVGPPRDPLDGAAADAGAEAVGELWMINLEPDAWGLGLATALLAGAVEELRRLGYGKAYLWVLEGNGRARRFYEREGWETRGERKRADFGDRPLDELRYWRAL
jgi:GNAT superfamily N-acetyltransferase